MSPIKRERMLRREIVPSSSGANRPRPSSRLERWRQALAARRIIVTRWWRARLPWLKDDRPVARNVARPPLVRPTDPARPARSAPRGCVFGALLGAMVVVLALSGCLLSGAVSALLPGGSDGGSSGLTAAGGTTPAAAATQAPVVTPLPAWTGQQRLTFLLMGMDSDGSSTPNHTDSMMLVSVDPVS